MDHIIMDDFDEGYNEGYDKGCRAGHKEGKAEGLVELIDFLKSEIGDGKTDYATGLSIALARATQNLSKV